MKMKKIELDPVILIGILLVLLSLIVGSISYYNYQEEKCISNPVDYANNYSNNYWWDYVFPIKW